MIIFEGRPIVSGQQPMCIDWRQLILQLCRDIRRPTTRPHQCKNVYMYAGLMTSTEGLASKCNTIDQVTASIQFSNYREC